MTPTDADLHERLTAWLDGLVDDEYPPVRVLRAVLDELGGIPRTLAYVRRTEPLTPPFQRAVQLGRPEGMEHLAALLYEAMAGAVDLLYDVPDTPQTRH